MDLGFGILGYPLAVLINQLFQTALTGGGLWGDLLRPGLLALNIGQLFGGC
jgi:hypothetical protein